MRNKNSLKRKLSAALALVTLITNVQDFGLLMTAMANTGANQIAVLESSIVNEENSNNSNSTEVYEIATEEVQAEANGVEAENGEVQGETSNTEMETEAMQVETSILESETKINVEEIEEIETGEIGTEESNAEIEDTKLQDDVEIEEHRAERNTDRFMNKIEVPEYEKTEIPEDIEYDEIIEGDVVITSNTTINNKKILYTGNVDIEASVTINNSIVRVEGTFVVKKGTLTIQGSNSIFYVDEDIRVQGKNENNEYVVTSAYIRVQTGAKLVVVVGDFYTESTNILNRILAEARLELHGDFIHIGDTNFNSNIALSGLGEIVFVGEKEQHIAFGNVEKTKIGKLVIQNKEKKLNVDTKVPDVCLTHDTVLVGEEVEIRNIISNGNNLNIEGNFCIYIQLFFFILYY